MAEYIVGLPEYAEKLKKLNAPGWIDLRSHALEGVEEVDRYTYRVTLKGRYPQFVYWLAMPFFSPIPWEAESSSTSRAWSCRNFTLDWWPVGTGPYMLTENDPNAHGAQPQPELPRHGLSLRRRTRRRGSGLIERFREDHAFHRPRGVQPRKGKRPYWNKFLQGYYDSAGISAENFDQAVRVAVDGAAEPSPEMVERHRAHHLGRRDGVLLRLQHEGPGGRGQLERAQAAPGDPDRRRHGGVPVDLPERPASSRTARCRRAFSAPATGAKP